jgi:DNA modification methylase
LAPKFAVEQWSLSRLKPHPEKLRRHSEQQLTLLAAGIRRFGCLSAIVVDERDVILKGHAVCEAAKRAELVEVNVVRALHLTTAEKRAYRIADNKLAELSDWDEALLKVELTDLSGFDLGFDVALTGFSTTEIDLIIDGPPAQESDTADELPAFRESAVTRPGDLWVFANKHRLLCGDARDPKSYVRVLGTNLARMAVVDAPYNVKIGGHVSGLGRRTHNEFAMASGEMTREEFTSFLQAAFENLAGHTMNGSLHYQFMDHAHIEEMVVAGAQAYTKRLNVLVWAKSNGGMGAFYRSRHELIFLYKNGSASHVNNIQLGKDGRYRTNVLEYPGANAFSRGRDEDLARHPTSKPWRLIGDLICDASNPGDWVLDCFAGGGTILIACEKTRRRAAAIEIDAVYCDLSVERWEKLTGKQAILEATGQTYAQVKDARASAVPADAAAVEVRHG